MPHPDSATILVVEHSAAVRELIDQVLCASGHRVLSTSDAFEAIEVASRVRIDVVVAGVLLEAQRQALLCQLRSAQPDLHVIICDPDDDETIGHATKLSSPFSLDDLREAVGASLATRRDRAAGR